MNTKWTPGFHSLSQSRWMFLAVLSAFFSFPVQAAPDSIWIESETITKVAPAAIKPSIENVGKPAYLSGGKWLSIRVESSNVDKIVPADGILLSCDFTAPAIASYNIWNRVGYEKIRSSFDWRLDSGEWTTVTPDTNTVDVEELQTWNPVGWLLLGARQISAGAHTLQFRINKSKDDKGNFNPIVFSSDALYLTPGTFHPDGPRQPGDPANQTEADKGSAAKVFAVTAPTGAAQTATPLSGEWQIAAADELKVDDRLGPIKSLPDGAALSWHAVPIPSDRNTSVPEMAYVHRYLLRTRVSMPASLAGRAFYLHLPAVNMTATMFVNGQACGFTKNPFAAWDCDITRFLHPGQVNEIIIGIKDPYYGLADPDDMIHPQYIPFSFFHYSAAKLDMPVLYHTETGVLRTPFLVVAGKVYTSDVFAIPSVKNRTLGLEITLHNPTTQPVTVTVGNAVVPLAGGPPEKMFTPKEVSIAAGQNTIVKLSEAWANPKLWWPDSPSQYTVITTLKIAGVEADERTTKFGFREWEWQGTNFKLNGVPWHGHEDATERGSGETFLTKYHKDNVTMRRIWSEDSTVPDTLDFADAHGIVLRRTGIFDGEGSQGLYDLRYAPIWDNYRSQLAAWIKSQRNHPSIFIWSIENEITFINGHVTGNDDITTRQHHATAEVVTAADPTRPYMVDGGNALLDESFPVYGGHYMDPAFTDLPAGAYDKSAFAHRQVWPVTKAKPILLGETYFAAGNDLGDFATVGGESAFIGKAEARYSVAKVADILAQGYRWNNVNFDLYFTSAGNPYVSYNAWKPIAALVKQWDSTFLSGQKVTRTVGLFNDTRVSLPISFAWTLTVGGRKVAAQTSLHTVPAGGNQKFDVVLPMPVTAARQKGTWSLALSVAGKPVFQDVKALTVFSPVYSAARKSARLFHRTARFQAVRTGAAALAGTVAVYDPLGSTAAFLRKEGVPFQRVASLKAAPSSAKVLVIGTNALSPAQSISSGLAAFALAGHAVIVLDQKNPLHYQALPGEMGLDSNHGSIAFLENAGNPILRGLTGEDFFAWGGDGQIYRDAYVKPTSGGRSLVQCGSNLQNTALAEFPVGQGVLLLSQLLIGEKLPTSAVAQQLLLNLVAYGQTYTQVFHPVTAVLAGNAPLAKALDATGLRYSKAASALAAISKPGTIAVVDAAPANVKTLAANLPKINTFTAGGGWIVFNNLTPDGLADYNKIVGVSHLIRAYKQEKVTWSAVRNPLTMGLAASNIVLGSGKRIFDYAAGEYPDTDGFSYVVDYDDVAPFAKSTFFAWDKITNNYTMSDGFWPLIINLPALANGKPNQIPMTLPRPEKITQLTWVSDTNYAGTTRMGLAFDGKNKISFNTLPNGDLQTFAITPPRTAQTLTLSVDDWTHDPAKQQNGQDLIGIDNIYLKAYRSPEFYQKVKAMLNIGALVEYPRGAGGIVLCNVKFKDSEANPQNTLKKQNILAAILRNLNAPFSGGKTIIAGAKNLTYTPLDISKQANQYVTDQGWFGDKQFTFADLPRGRQSFAGVTYNIYNFTTSPVPNVIMLGSNGIPGNLPDHVNGIPVGRKADALFFLQAARIGPRRSSDEVHQQRQYEMADYCIHYADGQMIKVPVYAEISVDDYKQKTPAFLPGAQTAWIKPYAGTDQSAVAYSMQWNNPRPDVAIQSFDLTYGPDQRGVPSLLAVTAATAAKQPSEAAR